MNQQYIIKDLRRKIKYCIVCKKPILYRQKNAKYCKKCAKIMFDKQAKEYLEKIKRGKNGIKLTKR